MDKTIESQNKSQIPIHVTSEHNGMYVSIKQGKHKILISIDQAAELGVEVLNHTDVMAKKHLGI